MKRRWGLSRSSLHARRYKKSSILPVKGVGNFKIKRRQLIGRIGKEERIEKKAKKKTGEKERNKKRKKWESFCMWNGESFGRLFFLVFCHLFYFLLQETWKYSCNLHLYEVHCSIHLLQIWYGLILFMYAFSVSQDWMSYLFIFNFIFLFMLKVRFFNLFRHDKLRVIKMYV